MKNFKSFVWYICIILFILIGLIIILLNRKNAIIIEKVDVKEEMFIGEIVLGENKTLTGKEASYKNPIIPVGFRPVGYGASWNVTEDGIEGWNDGLVIEDEQGNQFVWVPVDGKEITYGKWCYDVNNFGLSYDVTMGDDLPEGIDENNQIIKYGGFWIGRYEAGRNDVDIASVDTNNVSSDVEVLIKKGAQPWNLISYVNAKTVAENYKNNENVRSGLLTGTQWDATMRWIEKDGYDVIIDSENFGNYYNSGEIKGNGRISITPSNNQDWKTGDFEKEKNEIMFLGTGLNENAKTKNIYDLAGNVWEWTSEKYSVHFIYRGGFAGDFSSSFPAGFRGSNNKEVAFCGIGFRIVLYVM